MRGLRRVLWTAGTGGVKPGAGTGIYAVALAGPPTDLRCWKHSRQ
jgi:hypothetical protein